MRIILKTWTAVAGAALVALGALAGCSTGGSITSAGGRIRIVVAENFWGSIVEQLAGPAGDVTSIITNPATDPHDYEFTAKDARTIATARYVIINGIGYDAWAQQAIDANPDSGRTVLNVGDLLGLDSGANPHQWYSPDSVHRFVARVTADLAKIDPRNRAAYLQRERAFESSGLGEYRRLIAMIRTKYRGVPIGASESVVSPLATALELRVVTPSAFLTAVAEGNEPTESDKATADAQIAEHKIAVFVYNSQNATPDVQRLVDAARHRRIPIVTVTETMVPAAGTFQSWQVRQLRALFAALTQASAR